MALGTRIRRCGRACALGLAWLLLPGAAFGQGTTVFSGGSLSQLRALSPSLTFGALVIDGPLEIDLNADAGASRVEIRCSSFELTSRGSIGVRQSACSYLPDPDLAILASGAVTIDGLIDLRGKSGDVEISSLSPVLCPETSCNSCFGADGGDLRIRGRRVLMRGAPSQIRADVSGGWGSTLRFVEYDSLNFICRTFARSGCSGGDGGLLRLEATERIDLESAGFELGGGAGGFGVPDEGTPGDRARLEWSAPLVAVQEVEPNGSVDLTPEWFPGAAQPLAAAPVRVQGFVSWGDDADDPNPIRVLFDPPASNDRLEDLFVLHVPVPEPIGLALTAADARRDLDLYLIDPFAFSVLAESNGPPGTIERIDRFLQAGWYLVGVSWCCDVQTLPAPPGTAYTLQVIAAPEPSAAFGAAAAFAVLAVCRAGWPRRRAGGMHAGRW